MEFLRVEGITKAFGGIMANDEVTLAIDEGEIVGLVGHNGAGKTTLFNVIAGDLKPDSGRIAFRGEDITGFASARVASKGIVRTFQASTLFNRMTVYENLNFAHYLSIRKGFWKYILNIGSVRAKERAIHHRTKDLIDLFGLGECRDTAAQSLPYGHQRALGIAIAMAAHPSLLMLDEPVAGMNETESAGMADQIKRIRDTGVTVLVIEHDMKALMGMSDRVVAMAVGRKIAEGTPAEIQRNEDVIESYLGKDEDW
jgi:branched-chain amino acid transport system ATP-binding protein